MTTRPITRSYVSNLYFPNEIFRLESAADKDVGAIKWEIPITDYNFNRFADYKLCLNAALEDIYRTNLMRFKLISVICFGKKPISPREYLFITRYPKRYFVEKKLFTLEYAHWETYLENVSIRTYEDEDIFLMWFEKNIDLCDDRTVFILQDEWSNSFLINRSTDSENNGIEKFLLQLVQSKERSEYHVFSTYAASDCVESRVIMRPNEKNDYPLFTSAVAIGKNQIIHSGRFYNEDMPDFIVSLIDKIKQEKFETSARYEGFNACTTCEMGSSFVIRIICDRGQWFIVIRNPNRHNCWFAIETVYCFVENNDEASPSLPELSFWLGEHLWDLKASFEKQSFVDQLVHYSRMNPNHEQ